MSLDLELLTALIAGTVAIIAAIISYRTQVQVAKEQVRITNLEHELEQQREQETREAQVAAIMAKYRDPMFRAAQDFQSRLYNIVKQNFLVKYGSEFQPTHQYAVQNTMYVIAEFLGWVEILRREVQFLDLGDVELNGRFIRLLDNITSAFSTDKMDMTFCIFRGEQRAIGELMIVPRSMKGELDANYECIGYATFVSRLEDPDFARWFENLAGDIERLTVEPDIHEARLIALQHELINLIDFLDPNFVRLPADKRKKFKYTDEMVCENSAPAVAATINDS